MTSITRTQYTDQVRYGRLDDEEAMAAVGAKAKLGTLDSIARFFYKNCCCGSSDAGLAKLGRKVVLSSPVSSTSDVSLKAKPSKKKSKKIAIPTQTARTEADVSPSRASTDSDRSRSPSPPYQARALIHVASSPAISGYGSMDPVLARLKAGQPQTMADAIHGSRTLTTSVAAVAVAQPKAVVIENLSRFVRTISLQEPVVTVSHRIGENFQVNVDYKQNDGPMRGSSRRKTYLVPVEEIRQLGSSHSTTTIDLGAHLRNHLKANFASIKVA